MASVNNNPLLEGSHGAVGDKVYREINGQTFVSKRPGPRKKKQSEAQEKNQSGFREVSAKAKKMMEDPILRAYYREEALKLQLPNAYTAAVKELRNQIKPPRQIDLLSSRSPAGTDNFPLYLQFSMALVM